MVNYAQAKVYRLVNNVDGKEYVGSTCNPLHKRKAGHKRDATKSPKSAGVQPSQHNRVGERGDYFD